MAANLFAHGNQWPATSWEQPQLRNFVRRRGTVISIALAFNAAGRGVAFWEESSGSDFDFYVSEPLDF